MTEESGSSGEYITLTRYQVHVDNSREVFMYDEVECYLCQM